MPTRDDASPTAKPTSDVAVSGAAIPNDVARSPATSRSDVAVSGAAIPNDVARSPATSPSDVALPAATIPSDVARSPATIPNDVARSPATIPSDVAFSPAVKAVQHARGSRSVYARQERPDHGWPSTIDDDLAGFLAQTTTCFLATASADGQPYVQHRGGPAGFLRVLDAHRIAWADFRGNRQYVTTGNLSENPRVCLFLIDYAHRARVKIWGTARVIHDAAYAASLAVPGYAGKVEQAIELTVTAWDVNCPQHIPQLVDAQAVATVLAERDALLADRDAQLTALRSALASVRATLAEQDAQLAALRATLAERDAELVSLRASLADRDAELDSLRATLADRDVELDSLRASLAARGTETASLRATLAERDA